MDESSCPISSVHVIHQCCFPALRPDTGSPLMRGDLWRYATAAVVSSLGAEDHLYTAVEAHGLARAQKSCVSKQSVSTSGGSA